MALIDDEAPVEDAAEARMTIVEHLAELRKRLMISLIAVVIAAAVVFASYNPVLDFLLDPYKQARGGELPKLFVTDPMEGLTTRLKVAGWGGLFVASPIVLWQLWRFITPGLHKNEKKYAIPFVLSSVALFGLGLVIAYLTFPKALDFLIGVSGPNVEEIFSPNRYISFLLRVMFAFGIAFEFPIVLVFLQIAGIVSPVKLRGWRRQASVLIIAAAAILTPSQDPWSLLAMAVPMYVFYEAAIIVGRLLKR